MTTRYMYLQMTAVLMSAAAVVKMFCRCQPVYVKYSILGLPEHRSEGLQHDVNLYWNDVNVIFTGSVIVQIG